MEYINGNKSVCQEDCDFSEYNYISQRANCSCKVQQTSNSFAFMNINKTKLFENFIYIEKISNVNILKCHKELFRKKGILNNIGCLVTIIVMIFHIICLFIFYINQLGLITNNIQEIIFALQHFDLIKSEEKNDIIKQKENQRKNNRKYK